MFLTNYLHMIIGIAMLIVAIISGRSAFLVWIDIRQLIAVGTGHDEDLNDNFFAVKYLALASIAATVIGCAILYGFFHDQSI